MARGLSSDIKTALSAGDVVLTVLTKLELNSTYYQTSGQRDISYGGNTYLASGLFLGLDAIEENSSITTGSPSMRITGASTGILDDLIANGHTDKPVTIYLALLDSDGEIIDAPVEVFAGSISGMNVAETEPRSTVKLSVANHWADYERQNGRRTTDSSQQRVFNGDRCFNLVQQTGKKLTWGVT